MVQDSGLKSEYDGRTQLNNIYATPKWQRAITDVTSACAGKVQRALGFTEEADTSEDKNGPHPYYLGDSEVSKGDAEQGETGRSASSITHMPSVNISRPGSTKRARTPFDPRSYVPPE